MSPRRGTAVFFALLALLSSACGSGQDAVDDRVVDEGSGDVAETDALLPLPDEVAPDSDGDGQHRPSLRDPQVPPLLPAIDDLDETVVTITTTAGDRVRVDAKVAATPEHRGAGLMRVPELPPGVGMLFLFEEERSNGFWMYNTLMPLDIAYADGLGRIGTIRTMEPCGSSDPDDCPGYPPDGPYRAALEVPEGWFADVGVSTGDTLSWLDPVPVD